MNLFKLR